MWILYGGVDLGFGVLIWRLIIALGFGDLGFVFECWVLFWDFDSGFPIVIWDFDWCLDCISWFCC